MNDVNSRRYYKNKYCRPGKTLYYCLRKIKNPQRETIIAIHAFYREIFSTLFKCSEPMVARIRLQWWRDEISRLYENKAQHAITIQLAQNIKLFDLNSTHFFSLINAIDRYFNQQGFENENEVDEFILNSAGKRDELITQVLKIDKKHSANIKDITLYTEKAYHLKHLQKHLQKQCVLMSNSQIKALNQLISQQKPLDDFCQHYLARQNTPLPAKSKKIAYFTCYLIMTNCHIRKIKCRGYGVHKYYYSISPINKLIKSLQA